MADGYNRGGSKWIGYVVAAVILLLLLGWLLGWFGGAEVAEVETEGAEGAVVTQEPAATGEAAEEAAEEAADD